MRSIYFLVAFLLVIPFFGKSQLKIQTIKQDNDGVFSNLNQLDQYLGKARIVSLGEQTHADGATFDAKVQLIKYLHEQLGFNVLAFESSYYECNKANELLSQHKENSLKQAVFGIWDNKALKELEDYILQTQNTSHPLKITGFDFQFSGQLAKTYFIKDVTTALKQLGDTSIMSSAKWIQFKRATEKQIKFSNYFKKASGADTAVIGEIVRSILAFLNVKRTSSQLSDYLQMICNNLVADTRHRYESKNFRDSVMATNLLKLASTEFEKEKIICWNATSHFIYNPKLIEDDAYQNFVPMGDYLHKEIGDKLYTIGFTSLEGKAGTIIKYKLKSPPTNSMEYLLGKSGIDFGFVDFSKQSQNNINALDTIESTRMLGNQFLKMPPYPK